MKVIEKFELSVEVTEYLRDNVQQIYNLSTLRGSLEEAERDALINQAAQARIRLNIESLLSRGTTISFHLGEARLF